MLDIFNLANIEGKIKSPKDVIKLLQKALKAVPVENYEQIFTGILDSGKTVLPIPFVSNRGDEILLIEVNLQEIASMLNGNEKILYALNFSDREISVQPEQNLKVKIYASQSQSLSDRRVNTFANSHNLETSENELPTSVDHSSTG